MKQTLDTPYDPGPLLLDGPNVNLTSADQIFARQTGKATPVPRFGVRFDLEGGRMLELRFSRPTTRRGLIVGSMQVTDPSLGIEGLSITPKLSKAAIAKLKAVATERLFTSARDEVGRAGWDVTTRRCFLEVMETFEAGNVVYQMYSALNDLVHQVETLVSQVIHLPGLRGNPERAYPRTAAGSGYPGQFQDYVASIVHAWQEVLDPKLSEVAESLERLGLTWTVKAREIDDTRLELLVGRLPHGRPGEEDDLVNMADVGLGTSQILPVLVALRVAKEKELLILEQPEIHLHPRAQRLLARPLAAAARRGVRVVVETHSSLLLRGIQTLIARDEIPPDLVSLHWFTRDPSTGMTKVATATVDEFGRFGDWPEDFDEVTLGTEQDYLDAVEGKYARQ